MGTVIKYYCKLDYTKQQVSVNICLIPR